MQASTPIEEIYVSTGKSVNLQKVNPSKVIKTEQLWRAIDLDSKTNTLKFRFGLSYLGKEYENVVVPCTPAHQICHSNLKREDGFKDVLSFVKVPYKTSFSGYASGRRSAIFTHQQGKIIRLKGCGNYDQGFPKSNLAGKWTQSVGHHFFHTSKRELLLTQEINSFLKQELKIDPPANRPLYCYNFPDQQIKKVKIENALALISKYCCIFETQGDRRVGTHLISALQILYLELLEHKSQNWKPILEAKNRINDGEIVQLLINYDLSVKPNETFLDSYKQTQISHSYVLLSEIDTLKEFSSSIYEQKLKQIAGKLTKSEQNKQKILKLLSQIPKDTLSLLTELIISRVGFEIGQIKQSFCRNRLNWGFYLDHGYQFHCNAHLNNFIVTKPEQTSKSTNFFILPLDFDLAFKYEQSFVIDTDSQFYGQKNETIFEESLASELLALQTSLYGLEIMNFKYGISDDFEQNTDLAMNRKMAKVAFRDTLVNSFHLGMRGKQQFIQNIKLKWDQNISGIQKVVEACLYLSLEFET